MLVFILRSNSTSSPPVSNYIDSNVMITDLKVYEKNANQILNPRMIEQNGLIRKLYF